MTIHLIDSPSESQMAEALQLFENQFVYPLGLMQSFRISHGRDYARFPRSIGDGCCFVYEVEGRVLGTVAVALKKVRRPDNSVVKAAYILDLKIDPVARRGDVLFRLLSQISNWCATRASYAFAVVMDGTSVLPISYTGRLGIPAFKPVAQVTLLKFSAKSNRQKKLSPSGNRSGDIYCSQDKPAQFRARQTFDLLSQGLNSVSLGEAEERSTITPYWFYDDKFLVSGCLEDTARAKRLIVEPDGLLHSVHLSAFAYRCADDAAALLQKALLLAEQMGFDWLFTSVRLTHTAAIAARLPDVTFDTAVATIFAANFESGADWLINSSEI